MRQVRQQIRLGEIGLDPGLAPLDAASQPHVPRAAGVQRGNDLVRTQRRPVMELDPGAKAEDPALRRGVMLPREGQCGLRAAVFVEPHESFKYKRLQFVFRRGFGGIRGPLGRIEPPNVRLHFDSQRAAVTRPRRGLGSMITELKG